LAKSRTPQAKAKLTGAATKNPQRFRDRAEPDSPPLGEASEFIKARAIETEDDMGIKVWDALKVEIPWLCEADRALVEIVVSLRIRLWTDPGIGVQALGQLRTALAQMGATPADRSKITDPSFGEDEENPFAIFMQ